MTAPYARQPQVLPRPACTPTAIRAVLAANAGGDILQRYDEDLDAAYEQAREQGDVTPLDGPALQEFADLHAVPRGATCHEMRELIYQSTADVASIRSGSAAHHDLQDTAWRHEPVGG